RRHLSRRPALIRRPICPATIRPSWTAATPPMMLDLLWDDTEAYMQFMQNESFKRFVADMVYQMAVA
ncbi:MAG: hypothetical protein Q8J99_19760, partial [Sulfuritalea sp.]|nr:hypothetical protein [Sulfuritalea sp.]